MPSFIAYIAPLALMLPLMGQGVVFVPAQGPDYEQPPEAPLSPAFPVASETANPLDAFHGGQAWRQFRIEQRVIIRISPQPEANRNSLLAQLPTRGLTTPRKLSVVSRRCVARSGGRQQGVSRCA